jgi:uncharacterized protein YdaU (DUF1376 family)
MKDPAFLFYPGDWLGGTMGMTFEEKGAYIEVLMLQFNRGHMTYHMISHVLGHKDDLWRAIQSKFEVDKNGLFYNKRLEEEQNKRIAYTTSRKKNIKGENQFTKNKTCDGSYDQHMTSHMENENININVNIKEEEKREYREKREETFSFKKALLNLGVSEKVTEDWLLVRKTKKAANTETAFKAIEKQIKECPISPDECVKIAVIKSWQGLKSEWIINEINNGNNKVSTGNNQSWQNSPRINAEDKKRSVDRLADMAEAILQNT